MVGLKVAQAQHRGGSCDLAGLTPCGSEGSLPDIPASSSGVAEARFLQSASSQMHSPFTLTHILTCVCCCPDSLIQTCQPEDAYPSHPPSVPSRHAHRRRTRNACVILVGGLLAKEMWELSLPALCCSSHHTG